MRIAQRINSGRRGFTLVELVVVVLIIVILLALVGAGVLKFLEMGPKLQTVNEVRQLSTGIENFKLKYKVYPPSAIRLCNNTSGYTTAGDTASLQYLMTIWPRLNWPIDWSGNGTALPATGVVLEGDQCLVYFLNGPLGTGWSTNPTNPTDFASSTTGPFFEFPSSRLITIPHPSQGTSACTWVPSFQDPYATPTSFNVYAYFCSGRSANGYGNHCPSLGQPLLPGSTITFAPFQAPATAAATVSPYKQANGRFYNPNSFQIISAGPDMTFGPGGTWAPGTYSASTNAIWSPGFDDLSNFYGDFLGAQ